MFDKNNAMVQGHVKIWDPVTGEVFGDKGNAIHYENMSEALALCVANKNTSGGYIQSMAFGNGATAVDSTGVITYLPTNTYGQNASLYNQTYSKIVDNTSALNADPARNYIEVRHTPGSIYTDIFVSCLLDYTEPAGQQAFDNSATMSGTYVFDEIGLISQSGRLLTHVIFHPVQKALNRLIQIDYTVRVQTLTNLSSSL
jgi:hypothetical protein